MKSTMLQSFGILNWQSFSKKHFPQNNIAILPFSNNYSKLFQIHIKVYKQHTEYNQHKCINLIIKKRYIAS